MRGFFRRLDVHEMAHLGPALHLGPRRKKRFEKLLVLRAQWLATCDERAVYVTYDDFHQQDMLADLACMTIPTHLICAGKGNVVSDEDLQLLRTRLPRLQIGRLPSAGHQLQVDDFAAFGDMLARALSGSPLSD